MVIGTVIGIFALLALGLYFTRGDSGTTGGRSGSSAQARYRLFGAPWDPRGADGSAQQPTAHANVHRTTLDAESPERSAEGPRRAGPL